MSALSNYAQNKLIDFLLRAQALTPPATWYFGLFTSLEGPAGGGTEVSAGGYARLAVASSLVNFSGTQGSGSTAVSTGTSGLTSNNAILMYGSPSANWGTIVGIGAFDALSGGNLWLYAPLVTSKVVNSGDQPPIFGIAQLSFAIA